MNTDALEFAEKLIAKTQLNRFGAGAFLTEEAIQKYQIIPHEVRLVFDNKITKLWFETTEQNAKEMIADSEKDANAWDCSVGIFCSNLLNAKPIPKSLQEYVVEILLKQKRRPCASEKYNNKFRNRVLSGVIYSVYMLYDTTERDACDIVKRAAQKCDIHTPNRLTAIWQASEYKKSELPERSPYNKALLLTQLNNPTW